MSKNEVAEKFVGGYGEGMVVFDLPHGVEYEGVLHKECQVREMLGIDEEAIAKQDVRNNVGKLITALVSSCTVRIGELTPQKIGRSKWENLVQNMFLGDRDLIMLKIRGLTNGSKDIEMELECPHCQGEISHILDIDNDIPIREVTVDPKSFSVELPRGHYNEKTGNIIKTAELRLITGHDQEQLDQISKKNPGAANSLLLTRCLLSFGGEKPEPDQSKMLSTKNREFLIGELTEKQFGPKMVLDITCPHCSKEIKQGVHPINFL